MNSNTMISATIVTTLLTLFANVLTANEKKTANDSIIFRATFDQSPNADIAIGNKQIYTAETLARKSVQPGLNSDAVQWHKQGGRHGGALQFTKPSKKLVFFEGGKNVPFKKQDFEGTVSLWMRLSPTKDLPMDFVDPLQITDKKWNDASFFIDFDKTDARDFRLGAFANYKSWNPTDRKFDDIPVKERPMVVVEKPPFTREKWTHVAFTWEKLNSTENGSATLYLDGKAMGSIGGKHVFSWAPEDVVIMLGINYVGWIDDLIIFDQALSAVQIQSLPQQTK